ncbi:MAG: hypothetical protein AAFR57_14990 [Pseudomonadota bacterium]
MADDPSNPRHLIGPIIGITVFAGMSIAICALLVARWAEMPWIARGMFALWIAAAIWGVSRGVKRIFARARGEQDSASRRAEAYLDRDD